MTGFYRLNAHPLVECCIATPKTWNSIAIFPLLASVMISLPVVAKEARILLNNVTVGEGSEYYSQQNMIQAVLTRIGYLQGM